MLSAFVQHSSAKLAMCISFCRLLHFFQSVRLKRGKKKPAKVLWQNDIGENRKNCSQEVAAQPVWQYSEC